MPFELVTFRDIPAAGSPLGLQQLAPLAVLGDRGLSFGRSKTSGVRIGKIPGYWTCPYHATITGVYLNTDRGGFTVKFWKNFVSTPTQEDSINRVGVSIGPPDLHATIIDLSDFYVLEVLMGETLSAEIVAVSNPAPTDISGNLVLLKLSDE